AAHDLADIHADDRLAVGLDDAVAGFDPGDRGRRAVDRGDDLRHPLLDRDFDADPAELAARSRDQLAVLALRHVIGMRVELVQHALQRTVYQRCWLDRHDIAFLDLLHRTG